MSRRSKTVALPPNVPGTRFTQERLFWGIDEETVDALKTTWKNGEALAVAALPLNTLCAVTLLSAWAHKQDMDIVDDYEELIKTVRASLVDPGLHHPELFFVSATCILDARGEQPTIGGFEQIGVPDLFEDLIGRYME